MEPIYSGSSVPKVLGYLGNQGLSSQVPEPVEVAAGLFGHPGEDTGLELVLGVLG